MNGRKTLHSMSFRRTYRRLLQKNQNVKFVIVKEVLNVNMRIKINNQINENYKKEKTEINYYKNKILDT